MIEMLNAHQQDCLPFACIAVHETNSVAGTAPQDAILPKSILETTPMGITVIARGARDQSTDFQVLRHMRGEDLTNAMPTQKGRNKFGLGPTRRELLVKLVKNQTRNHVIIISKTLSMKETP